MNWRNEAACISVYGYNGDELSSVERTALFYPEIGRPLLDGNLAKEICRQCTVRQECLDFAIAHNEIGIWGGMTDKERVQERTRRAATR